jgi:site-specific recombinase XerD
MPTPLAHTLAEAYDRNLRYARHKRLPPGYVTPQPTRAWPRENLALLEHYREWLLSGGHSPEVVEHIYLMMAGHVLGLNLKPHDQLDLDVDLQRALDYVKAKRLSAEWTDISRVALEKFRRFLRQRCGQPEVVLRPINYAHYCAGLPEWLVEQLERYQRLQQSRWRPTRLRDKTLRFWHQSTRLWRWLFERYPIRALADIKRQHVLDYVDDRLADGYAAKSVNQDLRHFRGFLLYLQDQDYAIPRALLRVPDLKVPESLPRFLTDEQVSRLRDEIERGVAQARFAPQRRLALLDRAAFYLLWQGGLRRGEVEELRLEDLDLPGKKLMVRQGKGRTDRTVYLTETAVKALEAYLAVRGMGPDDHVFLYRNRPLSKDLIGPRLKAAGVRAGVKVTAHRLRHTMATQLLNAGCRVTTIQKLLGHRDLNSTLIYARVHDHTVADDYYAAMTRIEQALSLSADAGEPPSTAKQTHALELVNRLAEPQLGVETRLDLVAQLRRVLNGKQLEPVTA